MTFRDFVFQKLVTPKTWSDKCLNSPLSTDPSASNTVNMLKHCSNLHHSIFMKLIDHCQVK